MASKTFCDRCGKEIEGVAFKLKNGVKEVDLCSECKQAFEAFMENK